MLMLLYFWIYGLFRDIAFFSCLAKMTVLFSTRCSCSRIPPLSLRGLLEDFALHSTIKHLAKASVLMYNTVSLRGCVVLQGRSCGGLIWEISELDLIRGKFLSLGRLVKKALEIYWHIWNQALVFLSPYNTVPVHECVILVSYCSGQPKNGWKSKVKIWPNHF